MFTDDNSEWRSDVSGDLYDQMIADLIANGDNVFGDGEGNLKDLSFPADRIGFEMVELRMTNTDDLLDPDLFTLPEQTGPGDITLYDYPQGDDVIPFLLAKGHGLSATSNEIVGIGWLDPRPPEKQWSSDGRAQDFLFKLSSDPTIPEPSLGSLVWDLPPWDC